MDDNGVPSAMINPEIFEFLRRRLDEETGVRETLVKIVQKLEKEVAVAQGHLCRIHSTRRVDLGPVLAKVEETIRSEIKTIKQLSDYASNYPYYKFNNRWSHTVQNAIFTAILCAWLGGMATSSKPGELGRLLTLEDIGEVFEVPVNLKDRDAFHITIEEYLLSLVDLTDELSRLAVNAVTLGDYELAMKISEFVKSLQTGFMILNLKNDILRKRIDGVKYHVKKVEDVMYDLSLRNLVPSKEAKPRSGS